VYRRKPVPPDWRGPDGVVFASACGAANSVQGGDYFLAGTESMACAGNPFQIAPQQDTAMGIRPAGLPATALPKGVEGSIGLDSLDFIELSIAIEERFGVTMDESEDLAPHFASFATLSRFIAGKLPAA
jgi:hypothetical protein